MQPYSICTTIGEKTYDEIMNVLNKVSFAEIRLDLNEISDSEIESVFGTGKKLIATCREGCYTKNQRLARLTKAMRSGAQYVDIETESDENYINMLSLEAKKNKCKIIISYHNFDETLSFDELVNIVETCKNQGADIVKLVTTARNKADAARVLSLYDKYTHGDLVAFAMGDDGVITRAACIFLGSPYTYASVSDDKQVANGQVSVKRMNELINILTDEHHKKPSL